MRAVIAFKPPIPVSSRSTISTFQRRASAYRWYIRKSWAAKSAASSPPVRLIGNGGGLVYAPLGPTHLAIEDISIIRALPNMTVVAAADADEMRRFMPQTVDHPGPIYIRLAKGGDPVVTNDKLPFRIGKAMPMREGGDALLVTTGVTLKVALDAAEHLARSGHPGRGAAHAHNQAARRRGVS